MTNINISSVQSTFGPIYLQKAVEEKNSYSFCVSLMVISQNNSEPEQVFVSKAKASIRVNQSGNNLAEQLTAVSNRDPSPSPSCSLPGESVLPPAAQPVNNDNELTINLEKTVPRYEELSTHPGVKKYGQLCWYYESKKDEKDGNFDYSKSALDVFIHFSKIDPNYTTKPTSSYGDKFHISVNSNNVPEAFNLLAGFLLSKDLNLFEWKITDMNDASHGSNPDKLNRVREGAQFTLYFHPLDNQHYTEDEIRKVRCLVNIIETTLKNAGITPGDIPDSDIVSSEMEYVSYRNDAVIRSNDKINQEERKLLSSQEFFKHSFADSAIKENNNSSRDQYYYEEGLKRMQSLFV